MARHGSWHGTARYGMACHGIRWHVMVMVMVMVMVIAVAIVMVMVMAMQRRGEQSKAEWGRESSRIESSIVE